MKIYLAPLEESGYTYRRALYNCFGGLTNILFLLFFQTRKDISAPEKRKTLCLRIIYAVPQILTKNAEDFYPDSGNTAGIRL